MKKAKSCLLSRGFGGAMREPVGATGEFFRRGSAFLCLLLPLFFFTACQKEPWEEIQVTLPDGNILAEVETHGGFHGDGESFLQLALYTEHAAEFEKQLAVAEGWAPLPLPEELQTLLWGGSFGGVTYGPCTSAEEIQLPQAAAGWYFFLDRRQVASPESLKQLLNAPSHNFTVGIYDKESQTLFLYALDT